jgi:GTP cyclohydrolase IA
MKADKKVVAMKSKAEPSALSGASLEDITRELLVRLGEDPERDGLQRTPERMARALQYLTRGYNEDPVKLVRNALFDVSYDEMVIVRDIEMFSLCEHHLLPFFGRAHIAYVPAGKVIGLSKLPRLVDVFARRLQLQERLTRQVAEAIDEVLAPARRGSGRGGSAPVRRDAGSRQGRKRDGHVLPPGRRARRPGYPGPILGPGVWAARVEKACFLT